MPSDGELFRFDHHIPHVDGTAIAEDVRITAHPEQHIFTYQHIYPNDPSLQRLIEVTATGGNEDAWEEIERTGKILYKNAQGNVFAQLEHNTEFEDAWLTVGMPKKESIDAAEALVQLKYHPDEPTQLVLQARPPDFDEIATYANWEQYMPLLQYFLQDEAFIKNTGSMTGEPYKEEYLRHVERAGLDTNRFLDKLVLEEVTRNARALMNRVVDEAFPNSARLQLQAWEVLQQFGMFADTATEILQETLERYEEEKTLVPMYEVLTHIKAADILQSVVDKTTKRIAQFRRAPFLDTVSCVLSNNTFFATLQRRRFGQDGLFILGEKEAEYGSTFPIPEKVEDKGHWITIHRKGELLHIVCDAEKFGRQFRNWEITVPYAIPFEELEPMLLDRTRSFQYARNIAPVVFVKPHEI